MSKPRTFYLTVFPKGYQDRTWWKPDGKKRAEQFLEHVKEHFKIQGKVIKVRECK